MVWGLRRRVFIPGMDRKHGQCKGTFLQLTATTKRCFSSHTLLLLLLCCSGAPQMNLWEQKPLSCLGWFVVFIHVTEWIWECGKCWGQHQLGGRVCSSELLWDSTATLFLFWWVALGNWSWPVQLPLSVCRAGVVTMLALMFTSWVSQSNPLEWEIC